MLILNVVVITGSNRIQEYFSTICKSLQECIYEKNAFSNNLTLWQVKFFELWKSLKDLFFLQSFEFQAKIAILK